MRIYSLKDQYELSLKLLSILMPTVSSIFIFIGICILFVKAIWWVGLIFIGIGLLTLLEYYFIRKYIKKKIKELNMRRI